MMVVSINSEVMIKVDACGCTGKAGGVCEVVGQSGQFRFRTSYVEVNKGPISEPDYVSYDIAESLNHKRRRESRRIYEQNLTRAF